MLNNKKLIKKAFIILLVGALFPAGTTSAFAETGEENSNKHYMENETEYSDEPGLEYMDDLFEDVSIVSPEEEAKVILPAAEEDTNEDMPVLLEKGEETDEMITPDLILTEDQDNSLQGIIKKTTQNLKKGTFTIAYDPSSPSGIKSVRFYVWTKAGKADKKRYDGTGKSGGIYTAKISNTDFGYKSGTFRVRASVTLGNGSTVYSEEFAIRFVPVNQLCITAPSFGKRKITILNPKPADNIKIKVWSEENGNDDVKTYKAVQSGNDWSVTVKLYNHIDIGTCNVRVYSGTDIIAKNAFVSDQGENLKRGWITENGLKFYYKDGVLQTDVRDRVSGPYHIAVNREQNTVTVYAKSSNGEFVIPVVSFICSSGEEMRSPIGTYTVTGSCRWKHFTAWDEWVQYAVAFEPGRYLHSLTYFKQDTYGLDKKTFNALGEKDSHGCIRLLVGDMKWIYDHRGQIEEIRIYDAPEPGPFGKPKAPKIGKSEKGYYDPTDPDAN